MAHPSTGSDGCIERMLESPQVRQAIESYFAVRAPHPDPELNAVALAILIEDMTGQRLTDHDIQSLSIDSLGVDGISTASAPRPSLTPDL